MFPFSMVFKCLISLFLVHWILENYCRSFLRMLNVEVGSEVNISVISSFHVAFLDPSIGQYCLMLATKTSMRNAIGEFNAAILCRWASLMNITSFSRCGLPVSIFVQCIQSFLPCWLNLGCIISRKCNHTCFVFGACYMMLWYKVWFPFIKHLSYLLQGVVNWVWS